MPTKFEDWPAQKELTKIALVGYTPHRAFAPFADPDWLIVGLNDLYMDLAAFAGTLVPDSRFAWFQLHSWENINAQAGNPERPTFWLNAEGPACPRDRNHVNFLRTMSENMPVFLMAPRPELPNAVTLPREDIREYFGYPRNGVGYFTNTISWMIGWALTQIAPKGKPKKGAELGVFGVDMAVGAGSHAGNEYGYQRPSCEWILGWAQSVLGRDNVIIPQESDLLATAFEYGDQTGNRYRRKQYQLRQWYSQQRGAIDQQVQALSLQRAEVSGRIAILDHEAANFMPGDHGQVSGNAPAPLSDVVTTVPDFERADLAQMVQPPITMMPSDEQQPIPAEIANREIALEDLRT